VRSSSHTVAQRQQQQNLHRYQQLRLETQDNNDTNSDIIGSLSPTSALLTPGQSSTLQQLSHINLSSAVGTSPPPSSAAPSQQQSVSMATLFATATSDPAPAPSLSSRVIVSASPSPSPSTATATATPFTSPRAAAAAPQQQQQFHFQQQEPPGARPLTDLHLSFPLLFGHADAAGQQHDDAGPGASVAAITAASPVAATTAAGATSIMPQSPPLSAVEQAAKDEWEARVLAERLRLEHARLVQVQQQRLRQAQKKQAELQLKQQQQHLHHEQDHTQRQYYPTAATRTHPSSVPVVIPSPLRLGPVPGSGASAHSAVAVADAPRAAAPRSAATEATTTTERRSALQSSLAAVLSGLPDLDALVQRSRMREQQQQQQQSHDHPRTAVAFAQPAAEPVVAPALPSASLAPVVSAADEEDEDVSVRTDASDW
jgi:hypothetical protein